MHVEVAVEPIRRRAGDERRVERLGDERRPHHRRRALHGHRPCRASGPDGGDAELEPPRPGLDRAGSVAPLRDVLLDEYRGLAGRDSTGPAPRPPAEAVDRPVAALIPHPKVKDRRGQRRARQRRLDVGPVVGGFNACGSRRDVERSHEVAARAGGPNRARVGDRWCERAAGRRVSGSRRRSGKERSNRRGDSNDGSTDAPSCQSVRATDAQRIAGRAWRKVQRFPSRSSATYTDEPGYRCNSSTIVAPLPFAWA